jgi:hypothetical protein
MAGSRYAESVGGLGAAIKAFQSLPIESQRLLNKATEDTATALMLKARANIPVRKGKGFLGYQGGALRAALDSSMSQKTGIALVGLTRSTRWVGKSGSKRNAGSTVYLAGKTGTAAGGKVISPAKYGHLVEFGSRARAWKSGKSTGSMPAHPFMIPAAESERANYLTRCHEAGAAIEKRFDIGPGGTGRQETL